MSSADVSAHLFPQSQTRICIHPSETVTVFPISLGTATPDTTADSNSFPAAEAAALRADLAKTREEIAELRRLIEERK